MELQVNHFLPILASLELLEWTLGDLIIHVFGPKSQGKIFGFWLKKWLFAVAVLTSRCRHSSLGSVSLHPKCD